MKVLVTGSSGFMGGTFGRASVQAGHDVVGLGRAAEASTQWPAAYEQTDATAAALAARIGEVSPDLIFHGAGTASVAGSFADPQTDFQGSVQLLGNVLEAMRRSESKAVLIFPSSAAAYGNPSALPVSEDAPIQPISPYGFHKAMCELMAREYAACFNLNVVSCRLFSVFGVLQRRLLVWELFKQLSGSDAVVTLEGTGAESRDFLEADDAVNAMLQLAASLAGKGETGFQAVNLASGIETKISELAIRMRDLIASKKEIHFRGTARKGDPLNWRAEISRLTALAPGWEPTPLNEALEKCVAGWQHDAGLVHHGA